MNDRAGEASADDLRETGNPLDSESRPLFEAAFREYRASLIQYVRRRVGTDADARDIVQEAFVSVLRYRHNQDLDSLRALLYRISANLIGMRARTARAQHWASHLPLDDEFPLPAHDPAHDQRLSSEQQLDRLMAVIAQLPTKCQQVFVLSRFHGLGYPEIAARCGISVKMVEKHITKALAICRAEVGGERP